MLWFWGLFFVLSVVVLAGRAHSRYLNRLDRESDQAWYVLLSGRANAAIAQGSQLDVSSQHVLLTPASRPKADSITLTFDHSDVSVRPSRLHLAGNLQIRPAPRSDPDGP
jgi:hypothetical protein